MKPNEKGILKQFSLVVYPIDVVVAIGDIEEEVNEVYAPNNEKANWIGKPLESSSGSTYLVHTKEDNQLCVMVWIRNFDECKGSVFAHEAGHVSLEVFNYVGATINPEEEQECFCYLLGTVFRLINGAFYEWKELLEKKDKKKSKSKKK